MKYSELRPRSCGFIRHGKYRKKIRHRYEHTAKAHALQMTRAKQWYFSYWNCEVCGWWHVGRNSNRYWGNKEARKLHYRDIASKMQHIKQRSAYDETLAGLVVKELILLLRKKKTPV